MKKIFHSLLKALEADEPLVLATLLGTKGSVPQVPGASAIFSSGGLMAGTLGGGILEGDAARRAHNALQEGSSQVYRFSLDADMKSSEGAICGGTAVVLLDADPARSRKAFISLEDAVGRGEPGVLASVITGREKATVGRFWIHGKHIPGGDLPAGLEDLCGDMSNLLKKRGSLLIEKHGRETVFLEAVYPLPGLYNAA